MPLVRLRAPIPVILAGRRLKWQKQAPSLTTLREETSRMADDPVDRPEYCVYLFFPDGSVRLAKECSERPAAGFGVIARIIITDGGDHAVFEWRYKEGVTFPPREEAR